MTNGSADVSITQEPVRVPESQIIRGLGKPGGIPTKEVEITLRPLAPTTTDEPPIAARPPIIPVPPGAPPIKRSMVLNIEATNFNPLKGQIISIGYLDMNTEDPQPTLILLQDEAEMVRQFMIVFNAGDFEEIITYGGSFDHRYIYLKCLKYRIACRTFARVPINDLMQNIQQVKQAFVYNTQNRLGLSDVADYLYQFPKPYPDAQMLTFYAEGNIEQVRIFAIGQIVRILTLHLLILAVDSGDFPAVVLEAAPTASHSTGNPGPAVSENPPLNNPGTVSAVPLQCPNCLSNLTFPPQTEFTHCDICNQEVTKQNAKRPIP